jgi:hypothetical protein
MFVSESLMDGCTGRKQFLNIVSQSVLELTISGVSSAIILIYNTRSRGHPGINLRLHKFLPPLSSQREFRVYTGARKKTVQNQVTLT